MRNKINNLSTYCEKDLARNVKGTEKKTLPLHRAATSWSLCHNLRNAEAAFYAPVCRERGGRGPSSPLPRIHPSKPRAGNPPPSLYSPDRAANHIPRISPQTGRRQTCPGNNPSGSKQRAGKKLQREISLELRSRKTGKPFRLSVARRA